MASDKKPVLIALAGPKGGVGKSFLSLNLAAALAARRPGVVLADLDLGAANLHALMGLCGLTTGLAGFINQGAELPSLLHETPVSGLKILPGSTDSLGLANLLQWQKVKLINHLKNLPGEIVVLDLGAGSTYNTLDFYDAADLGLLVMTPEMTSVLNTYSFVKSLLIRKVLAALKPKKFKAAREHLEKTLLGQADSDPGSMEEILAGLASLDGRAAETVKSLAEKLKPRLILNQVEDPRQAKVAQALDRLARRRLLVEVELLGRIPYDPKVRLSVCRMEPLLSKEPESPAGEAISALAGKLEEMIGEP